MALIPAVMMLGIGMGINQTRAVVEALVGQESSFVRTPKVGSGGRGGYRAAVGRTPWVEMGFCAYHLVGVVMAVMINWVQVRLVVIFLILLKTMRLK